MNSNGITNRVLLNFSVADPENSERGAKKHEISAASHDGHLFYDYFLKARGAWLLL